MKNQSFYTKKTLQEFRNPQNYGVIKGASSVGQVGNIICGDVMTLYIKVKKNSKNEEIIDDIKFKTYGCAAAIATSSVITKLAKGKTIDAAMKIDKNNIVNYLKGLPPIKIHCSVLAIDALYEAIYQYFLKNKRSISLQLEKIHKRIEKDKNNIEERYHDWTSTQK